jgi:hypothetical protein
MYLDVFQRPVTRPRLNEPHPLHRPQPSLDSPKDGVLPIQPRRRRQCSEELRAIGIRPRVRHAEDPRARVFQGRGDLVLEFVAVDGGAAAAGACGVAALDHEVWDDAVEDGVVVVPAGREFGEVLTGFGGVGRVELDGD